MKFVYRHPASAKNLAKKLESFLKKEGFAFKTAQLYDIFASVVGYSRWGDLLATIGTEEPSIGDEEADLQLVADRRSTMISRLSQFVPSTVASRAVENVRPTSRPPALSDGDFEQEDDLAAKQGALPKWSDPHRFHRPDLHDVLDHSGPLIGYREGEDHISVLSREEILSRASDPTPRSFEPAPVDHDEVEAIRAIFSDPTRDPMEAMAERSGGRVLLSRKGTKFLALSKSDDVGTAAKIAFDRGLFDAGRGSLWKVFSVRAKDRLANGNWRAAKGSQIGAVLLRNGGEDQGVTLALSVYGIYGVADQMDFEAVVTERGFVVVDRETKVPEYILRRDESVITSLEALLQTMNQAWQTDRKETVLALLREISHQNVAPIRERLDKTFAGWVEYFQNTYVRGDIVSDFSEVPQPDRDLIVLIVDCVLGRYGGRFEAEEVAVWAAIAGHMGHGECAMFSGASLAETMPKWSMFYFMRATQIPAAAPVAWRNLAVLMHGEGDYEACQSYLEKADELKDVDARLVLEGKRGIDDLGYAISGRFSLALKTMKA